MKSLLLVMTAAGLALTGCHTVSPERIDPSVRYPDMKTGTADTRGTLYVEGVGTSNPREQSEAGKSPLPTLFSVYDGNGNLVTASRTNDVDLRPGRYLVRPENVYEDERTTFWVTIEPGKRTVVDALQANEEHERMNVR
jgi:hypothetical protein